MTKGNDEMQRHYEKVATILGLSAEQVREYRDQIHNAVQECRQEVREGLRSFPEGFSAEARLAAMLVFLFHQPGRVSQLSRGNIYYLMELANLDETRRASVTKVVGPDPEVRPSFSSGSPSLGGGSSPYGAGTSGAFRAVHF